MQIQSFQQAINSQIGINAFLASKKLKDLVGGYGEMLFAEALGCTIMSATNQGFDVTHPTYGRVEIKTRRYELKLSGGVKKEDRAVGFTGKENGFDWLAHIVLDTNYRVVAGTLASYSEIWPAIHRLSKKVPFKVPFKVSSSLTSSIDISNQLRSVESRLGVGF